MHPYDTPNYFHKLLEECGFDKAAPDSRLVWETFKTFAARPVDCSESEICISLGCVVDDNPDQSAPPNGRGYLELCRDFAFIENGETVHQQLFVCFQTESVLDPRIPDSGRSSIEDVDLDSYFKAIERMEDFQVLLERRDLKYLGAGLG